MSKVYQIEIEETLQRIVEIKANSLDEAIDIARDRYKNEEYILKKEDLKCTEFSEYKDEVTKQKKHKEMER